MRFMYRNGFILEALIITLHTNVKKKIKLHKIRLASPIIIINDRIILFHNFNNDKS